MDFAEEFVVEYRIDNKYIIHGSKPENTMTGDKADENRKC